MFEHLNTSWMSYRCCCCCCSCSSLSRRSATRVFPISSLLATLSQTLYCTTSKCRPSTSLQVCQLHHPWPSSTLHSCLARYLIWGCGRLGRSHALSSKRELHCFFLFLCALMHSNRHKRYRIDKCEHSTITNTSCPHQQQRGADNDDDSDDKGMKWTCDRMMSITGWKCSFGVTSLRRWWIYTITQ